MTTEQYQTGKQALIPVPAGWKLVCWANINKQGDVTHTQNKQRPWARTALYARTAIAASPTPPAEQPAVAEEIWRTMETAPKDGTVVRLFVEFEDDALNDEEGPQVTIGSNTSDNTKECDPWQFAGWNWSHDCYTQGTGTPIGWLPLMQAAAKAAPGEMDMEKETSNARLDTDSNFIAPEQQRDVARTLEVGQHVGDGGHQGSGSAVAQSTELLKIAARNLRWFIEHAKFSNSEDRQAALNCLDVLAAPQPVVRDDTELIRQMLEAVETVGVYPPSSQAAITAALHDWRTHENHHRRD